MYEQALLAERFEEHRPRMRAVAFRLLGSPSEADDAVQETWLRVGRADTSAIADLRAWLTTIVARVALNMLRGRREVPAGVHLPEPVLDPADGMHPEHEALLADAVGYALLVVLDTLSPPERVAFVLHDMFAVPYDEIAPVLERSVEATRQLASRARRRVRTADAVPDVPIEEQRAVIEAFHAAAREGDLQRLVALLDPDVVLRADFGPQAPQEPIRGAEAVVGQAQSFSQLGLTTRPVLVNGAAGMVSFRDGAPFSLAAVLVRGGRIVAMDFLADPARLAALDLGFLDEGSDH